MSNPFLDPNAGYVLDDDSEVEFDSGEDEVEEIGDANGWVSFFGRRLLTL